MARIVCAPFLNMFPIITCCFQVRIIDLGPK